VALARGNWQEAKRLANQALHCRDVACNVSTNVSNQGHSLYLFLLAKAEAGLNQIPSAIETLERVRVETHPQDNPQVYSDSLKELQRLYFNQQDYLKAFAIKQEQGLVESQLGLRAFIGASRLQPLPGESQDKVALEITASGRGRDVERLIGRIARDDCKLTVIHGQSGVGKSSIVNGGLVPALRQKMVKALDVLPIPVRVYTNWVEELGRLLVEGETSPPTPLLQGEETSPPAPLLQGEGRREEDRNEQDRNEQGRNEQGRNEQGINLLNTPPFPTREGGLGGLGSPAAILEQLQQNEQRHRLVVLIFDQFEEFFFVCQDTAVRKPFFEFLSDCLNLAYVKVILSLREDYLHYLLECERLARIDVINNDILNKSNRYELGDFAPEDAQAIIEQLTARSQFHLESELELTGHQDWVEAVAFSRDGEQLLTGSRDKTVRLWDNQGNLIKELTGGDAAVAFNRDGEQILTGSVDGTARLWDNQGNLIGELTGHSFGVNAVAFSRDGKQILTGSLDGVRLWDNQGNLIKELTGGGAAVAFSRDGEQILTGSVDGTARLWDNQGNLIEELTGHQDSVIAVAFSRDGEQILTGSVDGTAHLWDNQGNLIEELTGHQDSVIAVAFSRDGEQILTGSKDKTTRFWDLQGGQIAEFAGYYQAISPDWRTIALSQGNKVVLKPVYRNLDELLAGGCDWLKDYLATHPEARERLPVCQE